MKKTLWAVLFALAVQNSHAAEWSYQEPEWGIPRAIHTQADLEKYEGYRRGYLVAGVGLLVGAIVAGKVSRIYARKAARTSYLGPVIAVPTAGGGSMGVQTIIPGGMEQYGHYISKKNAWKKGGSIGALAGIICLSISLSLRF